MRSCSVLNSSSPVSAAVMATSMVSRSRISPSKITSGLSRKALPERFHGYKNFRQRLNSFGSWPGLYGLFPCLWLSLIHIFNLDDPAAKAMLTDAQCPCMTFSCEKDAADLTAKNIKLHADGVEFVATTKGELARVKLPIPGHFSVENALTALGIVLQLGLPLADAAKSLATATGVKGRVEVVPTDTDYTVLIDYAHSPDGVENVLRAVRGFAKGRVVALFGCGGDRDRTKRPKMGKIAAELADFCIVTSDNPRTEDPKAIIDDILEGMKDSKTPMQVIVDRPEAIHWALAHAKKDDIIVLMGKGHETYQEVNHVKHHMDEREIVADYFAR